MMLCQRCGLREACYFITSCGGFECYELCLCLECRDRGGSIPSTEDQEALVAQAIEDARSKDLTVHDIAVSLGIDPDEIRRVMNGQGVSDRATWEKIRAHLIVKVNS
jgi:hypothetical protein